MTLNVHRNHKAYWGRGDGGKGVWRWGGEIRVIIYLSLHCHHQNDSCIQMGSDMSHFNVLLIVRDKVTNKTIRHIRNGEKGGGGVWRWKGVPGVGGWGGVIIYLSLRCHHRIEFCIKVGNDEIESRFNVS